jgi:hypothetical protein
MGIQLCVLCPFVCVLLPLSEKCDRNLEQRLNTKFLAKPNEAAKMFMVRKRLVPGCLNEKKKKILMVIS